MGTSIRVFQNLSQNAPSHEDGFSVFNRQEST
jgi:hypothetical protein